MNHSNLSEENRQSLEQAREYLEEAKRLKQQNKFQLSIDVAKQATTLYQQLEMWEQCIEASVLVVSILYAVDEASSNVIDRLEETLELAQKHLEKNHSLFADIFYRFGNEYRRTFRPKIAGEYYGKALEISKMINGEDSYQVGHLYGYIGENLYEKNDYHGSMTSFEKGLAILANAKGNTEQQVEINRCKASVHNLYGGVLLRIDFLEKALFHLNRALDIVRKMGKSGNPLIRDIYRDLGHASHYLGDYDKALLFFKKVLHLKRFVFGDLHYSVSAIKNNIAELLISTGVIEEAIGYLTEVIDTCKSSTKLSKSALANAYIQFGRIHLKKRNHSEALNYFEKFRQIKVELLGEQSQDVARVEFSIGAVYRYKQEYEKALQYYHQSLNKSIALGRSQYRNIAQIYTSIGSIFAFRHQYRVALKYVHKAIQSYCPNFLESDIYQNPKLSDISFFMLVMVAFAYKAELFFHNYQKETQALQDYKAALANYQLVDELMDRFRQSYHSSQSKKILVYQTVNSNSSGGIHTALNGPPDIDDSVAAFIFSEKNKARILYASFQENLAKASVHIPDELLQREREVKKQLTFLDKNIQLQKSKPASKRTKKDEKLLQQLQNEFFDLHQAYIQLIEGIEQNYPDYYQLKYQTETVSIEDIQANLKANQWMVSYFIGKKHYYIFLIGKEEFEVLELEKISGFEQLVEDFLSAIQNHQFEKYTQKGYELYQELLQPLEMYLIDPSMDEDVVQELIIIPHGILHYLPFEALLCSRPKSGGKVYVANEEAKSSTNLYPSLDYALLHFEVSYHYSATLWHYMLSKQGERVPVDRNSFVGFAPVYQSEVGSRNEGVRAKEIWKLAANELQTWATRSEALRSDGTWTPLPYSKLEVEGIASLFAQKGLPTQTFLHEQATKEQFREVVENSRFLLIAAHGVVNDKHPKLSGLVFYPHLPQTSPLPPSKGELFSRTLVINESPSTNNESPITNHQHDCILSMEETYHLNLNADLVVLSSCESGIGELAKGEGMMAVNRGFLYAGAKRVVSTLFKVYDQPSSLLTQYLFEAVLEGKSYAEALRTAKLKLLTLEEVDVKSWCGYVLIGT